MVPLFERQRAFNSALVDHISRNVAVHREFSKAPASTIEVIREQPARPIQFENRFIQYAQQISPYVDTKDQDVTRLIVEVAGSVSAVSEEFCRRWESNVALKRRYEHRVEGLRAHFGVVHQVPTVEAGAAWPLDLPVEFGTACNQHAQPKAMARLRA